MIKIYTLSDPRTNEIRYVGQTNATLRKRLQRHLRFRDNTERTKWLKSLSENGLTPNIDFVAEATLENWKEEERFYIAYFRFLGFSLTNMTDGGDGNYGIIPSEETRQKKREALKGYRPEQWHIDRMNAPKNERGYTHNEAGRKKMSETRTGRKVKDTSRMIDAARRRAADQGKKVVQYNENMEQVKIYESVKSASREMNCSDFAISYACDGLKKNGKPKNVKGFHWKYLN